MCHMRTRASTNKKLILYYLAMIMYHMFMCDKELLSVIFATVTSSMVIKQRRERTEMTCQRTWL